MTEHRTGHALRRLGRHLGLTLLAFLMLYPVLWMVVSSLRPGDEIFRSPGLAPRHVEAGNYTAGWHALAAPFGHYMVNSAVVVFGCILGNLVSCSLAAYAFARLEFSGRRWWFMIMLGTIMLPVHVIIVPQYVMFSQLHWVNTFLPLIVPKFLATDAFFVFLMVQFIRGLPRELDEAARIDGCGHPGIFLRVILPLMTPALATTAIFTFIWTWNDFFSQLIYLTDPDKYTVPVALRSFVDATTSTDWGAIFAMSVVSLVPVFLAFLFGQRYLTLLALALALPLTGCSGDAGSGQKLSGRPVTIRFTWWGADERQRRTQQVIELFQQQHPNITVKGEFKDWNGYWDSLSTTVAANDAPDVIQMDKRYLTSYAGRGALLDLGTVRQYLKTGTSSRPCSTPAWSTASGTRCPSGWPPSR